MYLAAWTWAWVAGALALSSAVVVLVHLLRLRRRRREVPYLPLFSEVLGDAAAAKRIDWLRRLLALLLSLGIVASLALALGDPRFDRGDRGRSIVVLVDRGVSMRATHEGRSRFEHAKDEVRRLVRALGPDDRVALVAFGEAPLPLAPLTDDVEALDHALEGARPGHGPSDAAAAIALARDILAGEPRPEIVVVSDGGDGALASPDGVPIYGVPVGEAGENLAIESLSTRRLPLDPSRAAVLLRAVNQGERERVARVELLARGGLVEARDVTLPPGGAVTLDLADVPVSDAALEARIVPLDSIAEALAIDDVAHAAVSPRRPLRVHVVGPDNLYLEAALLLDPTLEVTHAAPGAPLPEAGVDVFVFDRTAPPRAPSAPSLFIAPPAGAAHLPFGVGETIEGPMFERVHTSDRLVSGLRLADVNIADARAIELTRGDVALGRFGRDVLLAKGDRGGVPFVAMGFAVEKSDLPLRIAWPLFLMRAIDELSRRGVYHRPAHRPGEPAEVRLDRAATSWRWITPSGETRELTADDGRARFVPVEPGVHVVEAAGEAREVVVERARAGRASFAAPPALEVAGSPLPSPPEGRRGPATRPLLFLAGLAALLLLLEQHLFHRRIVE